MWLRKWGIGWYWHLKSYYWRISSKRRPLYRFKVMEHFPSSWERRDGCPKDSIGSWSRLPWPLPNTIPYSFEVCADWGTLPTWMDKPRSRYHRWNSKDGSRPRSDVWIDLSCNGRAREEGSCPQHRYKQCRLYHDSRSSFLLLALTTKK